ncbi:BAI1-associated protein 3, partial [Stegodyphus mimosarum]
MLKNAMESSASEIKNKNSFDGRLPEDTRQNLAEFCTKNSVSAFSEALAELLTLMEWHNEKKSPEVHETAIYNALLHLEKAVNQSSAWELYGNDYDGPLINITTFEMNLMEQTVSMYIMNILNENAPPVLFFPLTDLCNPDVIVKWRILEKIASIKVTAEETVYKRKLLHCIDQRIQCEVKNWLTKELEKLKLSGKSTVLKDTETLTKVVKDLKSCVTMAIDVTASEGTLFEDTGVCYFESVSQAVDEKLYPICQEVMESMDVYQQCHQSFHVNMRDSCASSHALYLQLKKLVHFLKFPQKSPKPLKLEDYNSVFAKVFVNLLQVLQSECHNRIKRAIEAEAKDTGANEEKILSSSVIALNCICTVIDEWKHMEMEDEDLQIAFLVKVADIVCDGAKIFAEALEHKLEVSKLQLKDVELTRKACILVNSVEHIRKYLQNIPQKMQWTERLDTIHAEPSSASLKEQVLRILNLIHQSMDSHLEQIRSRILKEIVSRVQRQCDKLRCSWLEGTTTNQSFDKYMNYLDEQMESLHEFLQEDLYPTFLSYFWSSLMMCIQNEFQEGQPPEYAKTIKQNIQDLKEYFLHINIEEWDVHRRLSQQIMDLLELNSKTTFELQLDYYSQIAESIVSPVEYLGHIAFQAGYKVTEADVIDLYINVQKGQRLPARKLEMSELIVKVELCPNTLFPNQLPLKSSPVTEDLDNPVFNELFQFFHLPSDVLSVKGVVIQVRVLNQDNSYSAEAVLLLNQVQNMSGFTSVEFLPVYLMPLRKFDMSHISYQVLESRSRWDKAAKQFISSRLKSDKSQKKFFPCIPGKNMMCNFASNN